MIIAYCERCGLRIPETELAQGGAAQAADNKYVCAKCAGAVAGAAPKRPSTRGIPRQTPASPAGPAQAPADAKPAAAAPRQSSGVFPAAAMARAAAAPGASGTARAISAAAKAAADTAPQKTSPVPYIVGSVGAVVFLIGIGVAMTRRGEEPPQKELSTAAITPRPAAPAGGRDTSVTPAPATAPPAAADRAPEPEPPSAAERAQSAKSADKELENLRHERAARLLEEHKAWFRARPQDPWGYKERLEALANSYRSSPGGAEAAKIIAELKIPEGERPPDPVVWHRSWQITAGAVQEMQADFDGRKYVLATRPIEPGKPCLLTRKWKVPEDKPFLEFSLRAHDTGDFQLVAVVAGKTLVKETIGGRAWRRFDLDLSPLKGQEAEISLQHHNTDWMNEHGWWQAPRFVDKPAADAKVVSYAGDVAPPAAVPTTTVAAPAQEARAWRALFDGRTLDCLRGKGLGGWSVENGAIVMVSDKSKRSAAQTQLEIEDGDLRVRFEVAGGAYLQFTARQGDEGGYAAAFDRATLPGLAGKQHELLFSCRGDNVTAKLDGQPWKLETQGRPRRGTLQFFARDAELKVFSIELGEPGAAAATVAAAAATPAVTPAANLLNDPGFESGSFGTWQRRQDPSTISDNDPHSGRFSARVGPKSGAGQKVSNLKPNTAYVLTGWVKGDPGEDITLGVQDYGGPPNRYEGMNATAEYKQLICHFTMGPNNTTAMIFYHKNFGKGYVFLDDVVLAPKAAASAVAPQEAGRKQEATAIPGVPSELLAKAPQGFNLNCYFACGAGAGVQKAGGATVRVGPAQTHTWGAGLPARFCNTWFQDPELTFEFAGLSAKRTYLLGFSWWDHDSSGRIESVWLAPGKGGDATQVLKATKLPAYTQGNQPAAEITVPVPEALYADGSLRVTFRKEGGNNAVAGEVWLWERNDAAVLAGARLEYEKLLSEVSALLLKNAVRQAVSRLEQAKADQALAAVRSALDQDVQCAKYIEDLQAAVVKGVAALADKQPFVLKRTDGKETPIGQGSKNTAAGVKGENIEVEMDLGAGAKAAMKVPLEQLAPETRFRLARLGIAGAPDAELKLAFNSLLLLTASSAESTPKLVRALLDAAKKAGSAADRIAHVQSRLEAYELEGAAEKAYGKLDALLKEKNWQDAKAAIENLRKEYASTLALAKVQAEVGKQMAEVDDQLNPARPGLWASYWSCDGENWFAKLVLARAETKLCWDWGEGSPDAKIPANDFAVKWAGTLRIEREGKYRFKAWADDRVEVWVNGSRVLDGGGEADVTLARGEHRLKVACREFGGGANVGVQWRLEGVFDWQELPPNLLWHDPRQAEKYQKE